MLEIFSTSFSSLNFILNFYIIKIFEFLFAKYFNFMGFFFFAFAHESTVVSTLRLRHKILLQFS